MDTETQAPQAHPLDAIEQRAMQAICQHLEPHDCQWNLYAEAARDVVNAIRDDIEIQALRKWAQALAEDLDRRGEKAELITPQDLRRRADELQIELDEARSSAASGRNRG